MASKKYDMIDILRIYERLIYKIVRKIPLDFEDSDRIEDIVDRQLYGGIPVFCKIQNPKHLK